MKQAMPLDFVNVSYVLRVKDGNCQLVVDVPSMEHAAEVVRRIAVSSGTVKVGVEVFNDKEGSYEAREAITLNAAGSVGRDAVDSSGVKASRKEVAGKIRRVVLASALPLCGFAALVLSVLRLQTSDVQVPASVESHMTSAPGTGAARLNSSETSSKKAEAPKEKKQTFSVGLGVTAMFQRIETICEINFEIENQSSYDANSITFKFDLIGATGKIIDVGGMGSGFVNSHSTKSESRLFHARCSDVAKIYAAVTTAAYNDNSLAFGAFGENEVVVKSLPGSSIPFVTR
ncbi:hypothetical protein [Azospirillum sp. sgz302134]